MANTSIWFHTPGPAEEIFPYHVVAGGERIAARSDAPIRHRYHQHVLILTLEGSGLVQLAQRRRRAGPGTITWLDTRLDYAHGCHASSAVWRYLWIGVQGFQLGPLFEHVSAGANPVTRLSDPAAAAGLIDGVHRAMRERDPSQAALNSASVAALLALILADSRRSPPEAAPEGTPAAARIMPQLRRSLIRPWRIVDMAEIAGLSPSQLHRVFRAETGLSPMSWFRRERINAAKLLLLDRTTTVGAVAAKVGYSDPFHFSRDFKKLTGRAPGEFRASGGS